MLFSYNQISHDVGKLHEFLEHTVVNVWGTANGNFSINKLHSDFKPIVIHIGKNKKDYLRKPIHEIYKIFKNLNTQDRQYLISAFHNNNNIKHLCEGIITPILYDDISDINKTLATKLKSFGKNLYSEVITKGKFCKEFSSLNNYYIAFVKINSKRKCPFCGLESIKSELLTKRSDFDHYFPKSKIPFISVNLDNLAPACDTCNKSYKKAKLPSTDSNGTGRKSFFPFSNGHKLPKIKVKIQKLDPFHPKKNEIELFITSRTNQEEIDTWRDLYGIDERYNDKYCSDDSKYWLQSILDEAQNYNIAPTTAYNNNVKYRKKSPLQDDNFLRVPFLDGCKKVGLI